MIALLENDKELQRGKFTSSFSKEDAERRWLSIANTLNSLPGARKAWPGWRKTWHDMKASAKKKRLARRALAESPEPLEPPEPQGGGLGDGRDAGAVTLECVVKCEEIDDTERVLVGLVGQHKCLWDPGDPDYRSKLLRDALWGFIARQLPNTGTTLTPESTRRKWQALRDARAEGKQRGGGGETQSVLMSFLDDVEFNEQYIEVPDDESTLEDPPDTYDTNPANPETLPTENPKIHLNNQREHKRTKRTQRALDPPNPQPELNESDLEGFSFNKDGHTHFCLSLAPLMRSLPLQKAVGVRIKILQLLSDAMADE